MFHKSVLETLDTNSPNTLHCKSCTHKTSTAFHESHFLDGVYLSHGTPLVDLVECLSGVEGTLGVAPLTVGWGASVELMGLVTSPTLLPLSIVAGVVTLVIGVTGNIEYSFNWLKESKEHELVLPSKFLGCALA